MISQRVHRGTIMELKGSIFRRSSAYRCVRSSVPRDIVYGDLLRSLKPPAHRAGRLPTSSGVSLPHSGTLLRCGLQRINILPSFRTVQFTAFGSGESGPNIVRISCAAPVTDAVSCGRSAMSESQGGVFEITRQTLSVLPPRDIFVVGLLQHTPLGF